MQGRICMLKLSLLVTVLFLSALKLAAQSPPAQTPNKLRLAIQQSKPDTNRISLQLKLVHYYLTIKRMIPGQNIKALDSASYLLNQATQLSIKLHETDWQYRVLELTADYYSCTNDAERCKQTYMRVIAYYHQKGNIGKEAHAWQSLAEWYDDNSDKILVQKRISYLQHSRFLYLKNNQLANAAEALNGIAAFHLGNKQFDLAENELQQVFAEYKTAGYKKLQYAYLVSYDLEYVKGNYYKAMAYCLQAIKNVTPGEDTTINAYFYHGMAECNYTVKKYQQALEWVKRALAAGNGKYTQDKFILIRTLLALNRTQEARKALNEILQEKPSSILDNKLDLNSTLAVYYAKINKYDLAVQYYLEALKVINNDKYKDVDLRDTWYTTCDNAIAAIYLKANQAAKAKKYITNGALALRNATTPLDPTILVDFYDNSYKYHVATGAYQAAIYDLQRRVKLQDSLFTADKDKQLAELNIQYQTAQQQQDIKTLHSQSVAQRATLEKANLQRNITIGGIVVMLLVSGLFYRNYQQKKLANNIITHKNELLQHLLTEKEWLLKEVHHRVKNNLHTVICLLESQARYLEDDALKAVENSQHRIYAMSLIHQKLYQAEDVKTIDMSEYIPELVRSLEDGFDTSGHTHFKLNIEPINLTVSHAIPIGLIINEAVTNSIKYAFPDNRKGEIMISMLNDGDQLKLEIADNGIGMPQMDEEAVPESLGLRLIKGLCEDIEADIIFEVDNGTRITILFKPTMLNDLTSNEIEEEYV